MTPHADPVRRAQAPRVQVMQGAPAVAALLLPASRGAPSTGASGGRCAAAHADWDGGPLRALPPPPPLGGRAATMKRGGGSQGSGAAPAPTGRSGSPQQGHGTRGGGWGGGQPVPNP